MLICELMTDTNVLCEMVNLSVWHFLVHVILGGSVGMSPDYVGNMLLFGCSDSQNVIPLKKYKVERNMSRDAQCFPSTAETFQKVVEELSKFFQV